MHVVIMGCGRVGSSLAEQLDLDGHSVSIIDQDEKSFRKLPPTFGGRKYTGIGFDRDVLKEAGIETAGAFAAVSSGDNSNIISARVARENFHVERVIARIYDPRRAEIYERLGIETIASVRWTTQQIIRRINPIAAEEYRDSTGTLALAELPVHIGWIGRRTKQLAAASGARIAYINRFGNALLPDENTIIQEGDIVHAILRLDERADVIAVFANAPKEDH